MSTYRPTRSTIFLYDFMMKGIRYSGSTGCKTKRAAEDYEAKRRAEVALASNQRRKPLITLDAAAALYEDHLRANGKWSGTQDYIIAGIVEGLGADRYLGDIGQDDLRQHFAMRAGKVSASSVNREIDVCRPIWRRLKDTHDIGDMPNWGSLRYAVAEKDPRELYQDEEARLLLELRGDHADFERFALLSGWRHGEVAGLLWSKVNLGAAVAETRIKGGAWVKRPLTSEMVAIIASQVKAGPFIFTYVCKKSRKAFIDKRGRKHPARLAGERYPYRKTTHRRDWKKALEAAGIESFRFHDLRHTRGTRILRATGNLALAKEALKHKSIKTTLRYAHASDDDVRKGLEVSESRTIPEGTRVGNENWRKSGES
jgi:integrase